MKEHRFQSQIRMGNMEMKSRLSIFYQLYIKKSICIDNKFVLIFFIFTFLKIIIKKNYIFLHFFCLYFFNP